MTRILQRYVKLSQTPNTLFAQKAVLPKQGQSNAQKSKNKRFDISDIHMDRPAKYYFKDINTSNKKTINNNIINNEEDNPHANEAQITVKHLKTEIVGYAPDGTPIKAFTNLWNDHGYDGYIDEMDNNFGDRFFFHASTNFLLDAAKKYESINDIQEFRYRPTKDSDFVRSAIEFFKDGTATNEEIQSMKKQMDGVVRELAKRIKNGENSDLHTLKSKITINGTNIKFGDLLNIRSSLANFQKAMQLGMSSCGSNDLGQYAKLGMLKPLVHVYAQNFDSGLRYGIEKAFIRTAETTFQNTVTFQEKCHAEYVKDLGESKRNDLYYTSNAYYHTVREDFYRLFSNLDTTNVESIKSDFESRLVKFETTTKKIDNIGNENWTPKYMADLRSTFKQFLICTEDSN